MRIGDLYAVRKDKAFISIVPINKNSPFVNKASFIKKIRDEFRIRKT